MSSVKRFSSDIGSAAGTGCRRGSLRHPDVALLILLEKQVYCRYNARVMKGGNIISRGRLVFLGILAAGILSFGLYFSCCTEKPTDSPLNGSIYGSDIPLERMPSTLLPGLVMLTPEQVLRTPIIDGFQSPIGTANGAFSYDAQPFASPNVKRGGNHTGSDLNGIGGNNTDEGDTVYAAARGLVLYSGVPHAGWGNVVVLAHRLPGDARVIQTLYAHLQQRWVKPGQLVGRGTPIGSIGTADGQYLAHLHFEMIASRCIEAGQPGYSANGVMNRLDPAELMAHYPAPPLPDPFESVRRLRLREAGGDNAAPAPELPQGSIPVNPSQFL